MRSSQKGRQNNESGYIRREGEISYRVRILRGEWPSRKTSPLGEWRDYTGTISPGEDLGRGGPTTSVVGPQRQLQGRRNRQWQPRQQYRTTVAKCASWRHVLASHWCCADMHGSVKRVLCVCQLWVGDVLFVVRVLYYGNAYFYSAPKR